MKDSPSALCIHVAGRDRHKPTYASSEALSERAKACPNVLYLPVSRRFDHVSWQCPRVFGEVKTKRNDDTEHEQIIRFAVKHFSSTPAYHRGYFFTMHNMTFKFYCIDRHAIDQPSLYQFNLGRDNSKLTQVLRFFATPQ